MNSLLTDKRAALGEKLSTNILDYLVTQSVKMLPDVPLLNLLKARLMKARGGKIGKRLKALEGTYIDRFRKLNIGDDVSIASHVTIIAAGGVSIGSRSMIGHGSKIISAGHIVPPDRGPMRFSGADLKAVTIESDVWLGTQTVTLPGVTVGRGAIVAAGAVVTKDVQPFSIVGGVPAKLIRMRN